MTKKLLVAEKPSVAADLAKALTKPLGKFTKKDDLYENDSLVITSALGHIVELFMPDDIDKKLKWWTLGALPILPEKFQLKPVEKTKKRLDMLKKLLNSKEIEGVINACDAGREGELIFSYIYEFAKCKKPVERLWMLSMTPESIRSAFQELRSGQSMAPLEAAARCRSESDWLVGINGTRAITIRMFGQRGGQLATVGRVQTPTLSLVYVREQAINSFIPQDYWKIQGTFKINSGQYTGYYQGADAESGPKEEKQEREDRIWNKEVAEHLLKAIQQAQEATVIEETKRAKQSPPLLYDLTTLQREANNRFGFSAARTLQLAQALYEKHKAVTYPRTDAKALPEDYGQTCREVLNTLQDPLQSPQLAPFAQKILNEYGIPTGNKRIFNNKKISDHFAIIPTDQPPKKLRDDEQKIYDLVAKRFLAVFFPPALFDITTRFSVVENVHRFKTEGKVLKDPGYLAIYGKQESDEDDTLPALGSKDGNPPKAKILSTELESHQTKPPARYTEATLLTAMENAGKLVEDEELAEAMKEKGLGTPATRAQIIDHLIREHYLMREERALVPTTKAANLMEFLRAVKIDYLTSPTMTGEWEHKLHQIEVGTLDRPTFMKGVYKITADLVELTKAFSEDQLDKRETKIISPSDGRPLLETFRTYRSQDGELIIYKTMGNRRLSEEEIQTLIEKKSVGPLDGFHSKAGKPFSAVLKLSEDYKVKFDFGNTAGSPEEALEDITRFEAICDCPLAKRGLCNHKDGKIYATPAAYQCGHHGHKDAPKCHFRLSRKMLSQTISEEQFLKLVNNGETDLIERFFSNKKKRYFSAHLILKDDGSIGFKFPPKKTAEEKKEKKPKK